MRSRRWSRPIDNDAKKMWRAALRFSALGLELGTAVLIGYGAGWWLDKQLGTKPYLTLVLLLFGIAAGFRAIVRAARDAQRAERDDERAGASDDGDGKTEDGKR
jgi:ATP synthase protein I